MASKTPFVVYVLPIILSVGLGAVVMAEALNNSDRTLNMWQFNQSGISEVSTETIQVIGLQTQYTTSESVDLQIKLNDDTFDCGDLYIRAITEVPVSLTKEQKNLLEQFKKLEDSKTNPFVKDFFEKAKRFWKN